MGFLRGDCGAVKGDLLILGGGAAANLADIMVEISRRVWRQRGSCLKRGWLRKWNENEWSNGFEEYGLHPFRSGVGHKNDQYSLRDSPLSLSSSIPALWSLRANEKKDVGASNPIHSRNRNRDILLFPKVLLHPLFDLPVQYDLRDNSDRRPSSFFSSTPNAWVSKSENDEDHGT